jgi:hypothetical protein
VRFRDDVDLASRDRPARAARAPLIAATAPSASSPRRVINRDTVGSDATSPNTPRLGAQHRDITRDLARIMNGQRVPPRPQQAGEFLGGVAPGLPGVA